jgi:hypothetical protein
MKCASFVILFQLNVVIKEKQVNRDLQKVSQMEERSSGPFQGGFRFLDGR